MTLSNIQFDESVCISTNNDNNDKIDCSVSHVQNKLNDDYFCKREPLIGSLLTTNLTTGSNNSLRIIPKAADGGMIRSRLLNRLGIEKESDLARLNNSNASRVVQQGREDAFTVALKADYGKPDKFLEAKRDDRDSFEMLATSPGRDALQQKSKDNHGVCFDAAVQVHPIPSRTSYSKRMKSVLWIPPSELAENAARNTLEFAAEEWDYNKVVDDEDMVLYGGERIHPIHFIQEMNLNQHFCDLMTAQQQEEKQIS